MLLGRVPRLAHLPRRGDLQPGVHVARVPGGLNVFSTPGDQAHPLNRRTMMPRIKLEPESLAVESYETATAKPCDTAPPTITFRITACPPCA